MPIVGQNGKENCLPATAESIEKHFGGDMTQDGFRALIGGNPDTDGIMDTEFWDKVKDNYKNFNSFKLNKKSFIKMERYLRRNYGIAITIGGDNIEGHSVVVSGIYQKQIINVKGCSHLSKHNWYRIMDPAKGGSYRLVNRYFLTGYNSFYLNR